MSMKEIDANSGIAPEQWVKDLQSQVTLAYDTIDGEYELIIHFFTGRCVVFVMLCCRFTMKSKRNVKLCVKSTFFKVLT